MVPLYLSHLRPTGAHALEDELLTGLRTAAGIDLTRTTSSTAQPTRRPCAVGHKKRTQLFLSRPPRRRAETDGPDGSCSRIPALASIFGEVG